MDEVGIEIERSHPGEYNWERILFSASNGDCQGDTFLDCGIGNFEEIGKALSLFLKKSPDEYSYTLESEWGGGDFTLHAYADKLGHTNLEITIKSAHDERRFLIPVEPAAIHRLGELVLEFSRPKYRLLRWSLNPDNDALVEFEYPKQEQSKLKHPKLDPATEEWERLRRKHLKPEEGKTGWTFGPNDWYVP